MTPGEMTPEEMRFESIAGTISGRYRGLLREVLDRLPNGWDDPRTFVVGIDQGSYGYACALRFEEVEDLAPDDLEGHGEQDWAVTLYPALLDKLSDTAVRRVIAHELGHVASGCVCGIVIDGRPMTRIPGTIDQYREISPVEKDNNERLANAIARAWGFWAEEQAFRAEEERLLHGRVKRRSAPARLAPPGKVGRGQWRKGRARTESEGERSGELGGIEKSRKPSWRGGSAASMRRRSR